MNVLHFSIALVCFLMTIGCGTSQISTYSVTGTVVFEDGSPVRSGTVELESRDHHLTATGAIRDDGSFVLGTHKSNDGACAGRLGVIVIQLIINDGTFKHSKDHGRTVDPVFSSYNSSPLMATIQAQESNTLKLTVASRGTSR